MRLKLNLVVLVLDDGAYGMIRWKQAVDGFADFGMTFGNPDFVTLRRGLRRERPPGRSGRGSRPTLESGVPGRRRAPRGGADRLLGEHARAGRGTARQGEEPARRPHRLNPPLPASRPSCERPSVMPDTETLALNDPSLLVDACLIGADWSRPGPNPIDVTNPATGGLLARVPNVGAEETRRAIEAAHAAFPGWRARTAGARAAILRRLAALVSENQEDLARILTAEQGKSLAEARGEVAMSRPTSCGSPRRPTASTATWSPRPGPTGGSSSPRNRSAWWRPSRPGTSRPP